MLAPPLAIELVPTHIETAADIELAIESFARVPNGACCTPGCLGFNESRSHHCARSPTSLAGGLRGRFMSRLQALYQKAWFATRPRRHSRGCHDHAHL